MGIWDSNLKRLFLANPQHFITWLLPGAKIIRELSAHLNRDIDIDILYEIELDGEQLIFHLEFQRNRDVDMAKRVLEYNVFASCKFDCTVVSFVIYLKQEGKIVESPLIRRLPNGKEIHRFNFINVKLWETSIEELRKIDLVGLLPLLPLTKEGAKQEVVEEIVTKISGLEGRPKQANLLSITFTLASLAFDKSPGDMSWLLRRFKMFQDILRDTEIYQYIMQEGVEKGREEGLAEGIQLQQERELQHQRLTVVRMVQTRFSRLASFAIEQTDSVRNPLVLQDLIVDIYAAQSMEEVRQLLTEVGNKNKR